MALIPVLDKIVNCLILRRSRIWQEIQFHKFRIKARPDKKSDIVESVLFDMSAINDKSASLLQHISVIMAVVTLGLGAIGKNDAEVRIIMLLAILIYFGNSVLLLRCLNIMGPPHMYDFNKPTAYRTAILREVLIRRTLFVFALRATILTSSLLLLGIVWFVLQLASAKVP